ncbi:hypothetical protein ABFS82_04G137400 [Erythranthe guttata]|uniref:Pentacotripeptide-repeat region of PRORP domain-containing protein n=1 Tax=Erythranthe guttata TaxID=4155 RepID=A0A022RWK5_ERYGU|nr:PREDICTED: pentatricopeptide repeat-containing protein At1g06270-like [Erythranthe guttata]EYU44128.1 hypothetical protein MIMGU_mgv1a018635mg [Erythranthe guttata]|eukprot:XP_012857048.1 PREDICTED: pentatricopeptide repeat-containing protein At1g06270-like [Erythranthe guttata]
MSLAHANFCSLFRPLTRAFLHYSSSSSQESLQESILSAIESKTYHKIPDLLLNNSSSRNPNPFSSLSTLSPIHKSLVIDEILQSFISIRPRSRPNSAYSHLLSYILNTQNPLPLALAVIQRTLRSGCLPVPQTHLLLSNAWTLSLHKYQDTVQTLLPEMRSIGYSPDCGTCNYLILSLSKVDRLEEALGVLRGMGKVGCVPDRDSFGILISRMSELRMIRGVVEMVDVHFLSPRKETVVKAVDAMRANREITRAVEMIEFLDGKGVDVGFDVYELALEGCLEVQRFVLAGKFVIKMTDKGSIPYIRVRRRVFEGLVGVGETGLASVVRQRFAELKS